MTLTRGIPARSIVIFLPPIARHHRCPWSPPPTTQTHYYNHDHARPSYCRSTRAFSVGKSPRQPPKVKERQYCFRSTPTKWRVDSLRIVDIFSSFIFLLNYLFFKIRCRLSEPRGETTMFFASDAIRRIVVKPRNTAGMLCASTNGYLRGAPRG